MPLDVQPLSRVRHAIRVIVLLALLAASLGFAHLLTDRRQNRPKVEIYFASPPGATDPMPVNHVEGLDLGIIAVTLQDVAGQPREFAAFDLQVAERLHQRSWGVYLAEIWRRVTGDSSGRPPIIPGRMTLAGYPALQAEGQWIARGRREFVLLRLTGIQDRIVAISFSGIGTLTDADRQVFEEYCAQGVTITMGPTRRKGVL